ncbi:SIMPL domain-containing protein [Stenotrophomonas sp. 24(2023)]|uniref:SIMPL domain-containing protein n=1 Tax=Stenotrophomonas sp. 24(2023) TaxID=3068324 RepID=UPI0027E08B7E|nr:SIMPL domain-containing protein [Stenotrophomonas sp. 24(2023)]WMJ70021.1 SIMPL domain-containing protein [Stenotrophomonas sp. 24(2023)]
MRRLTTAPLLLALSLALGASMSAHADTPAPAIAPVQGTLLNISANAEATRVPDVASLSAGVVTQAVDGNSAMRENAQQMDKVLAAIKAAGIAERDVQTSGVSLNPQYRYAENEAPKITGYQASNNVSVKVRDIARLGKVLDALAAQGANQINGPSFEIDKPEPVYDEARLAALKKAQERAQTYARSLGLQVRRIVSISENSNGGFRPVPMMMARSAAAGMAMDKATPVAPGESTVSVNLDVVFELGR